MAAGTPEDDAPHLALISEIDAELARYGLTEPTTEPSAEPTGPAEWVAPTGLPYVLRYGDTWEAVAAGCSAETATREQVKQLATELAAQVGVVDLECVPVGATVLLPE